MAEAEKFVIDDIWYDVSDPVARAAASAASTAANNAQATANSKIGDAPSNNKQYVRRNEGWSELVVPAGSGIPNGGTIGQVLAKNSDIDGDAGWYSLRHLPSDKWYLPDGILESDVIAAYQFVNRLDEAEALININDGTEYPLSKNNTDIIWNSERGFWIPSKRDTKLNNTNLLARNNDCVSLSFGYSEAKMENSAVGPGSYLSVYKYLVLNEWIGGSINYAKGPAISKIGSYSTYYCSSMQAQGVLSGNFGTSPKIYRNGAELSLSLLSNNDNYANLKDTVFGHRTENSDNFGHCYVTALVFYNIQLSTAQHLQLSDNIRALGGID